MCAAILAQNITKRYGNVHALKGISFEVPPGVIFGLLGPNGAGKTTTIKILTGLVPADSGIARVLGLDPSRESRLLHRKIGVVQQEPSFEPTLTVRQNLEIYCMLCGLNKVERTKRLPEVIHTFGLRSILDRRPTALSVGQRRRLQVAREFMHDSEVLFLDEPTTALDPAMRRSTLDLIRARTRERGLTVFLTSHNLEEVEYVCDRVAIMSEGTIIALDTVENLRRQHAEEVTLVISFTQAVDLLKAKEVLAPNGQVQIVVKDSALTVRCPRASAAPEVIRRILNAGCGIASLDLRGPTLEDVYLRLIQR